jgi:hypothetical protein
VDVCVALLGTCPYTFAIIFLGVVVVVVAPPLPVR